MSESDARKGRPRILYIANPDSDEDNSRPQPQPDHSTANYASATTFLPPPSIHSHPHYTSVRSAQPSIHPLVMPTETMTKAPNHPALSSPSSTSSPAAESTPPPTTPALPAPTGDFLGSDNALHQEPSIVAPDGDGMSRKLKNMLKQPFRPRASVASPRITSPIEPALEPHSSPSSVITRVPIQKKVNIVVTADADRYYLVDISGAKDPAFIKERIFTKLSIHDEEDQRQFSIWRTEIGSFAIDNALTDDHLFELCRDQGDPIGSLKFFVSHSSAYVHQPIPQPTSATSPSLHTIPPPVLPRINDTAPLRPKRSSRSRQGSLSSTGDPRVDANNGYEADLDNPDRESRRTTIRPPPHPQISPQSMPTNPPSPLSTRKLPQTSRNLSPLPRPPSPPQNSRRPSTADTSPPIDKNIYGSPIPPPLSPSRPNFTPDDESLAPPQSHWRHVRSGSDAAADREQAIRAEEQHNPHIWRPAKNRPEFTIPRNRVKRPPADEDWVHIDPYGRDVTRSSPSMPSQPHVSPMRGKPTSPYTSRQGMTIPNITIPDPPRNPPPAVPVGSDTRFTATGRPSGRNAVPSQWPVASYKHEDRGENKAMITSSTHWSRMLKGTKSMDNLKHPTTLQPGRRNNPSRLAGNGGTSAYGSSGAPPQASYASRSRPLPVQGPSHSSSFDFGQSLHANRTPQLNSAGLTISSNEPYPRPQSALGDHPTSPSHRYPSRQIQSPTFIGVDPTPQDILRSPRAISPVRTYPPAAIFGNRPSHQGDRSFNTSDPHRTPPRSPTSPRSPRYSSNRDRQQAMDSAASEHTLVNGDDTRATVTDPKRLFVQYMNASVSESTLIPGRPRNAADVPTSPLPPATPSDVSKLSPTTPQRGLPDDESDSDHDGCGTSMSMWAKPPMAMIEDQPKSILRPPLKVQIENANGSVYPVSVPSTGSESSRSNINSSQTSSTIPSHSPSPKEADRGSTFIDMRDYTWAPRPPPEDVYEHLEKFFPLHDLDKPVIEASSGGTSPTAPEYPPVPPLQVNHDRTRVRSKKSIRIVAQEHKKRIDRNSKAEATTYTNMSRKRSTKLWGSRLEEVTTMHAAKASLGANLPDSPPGGPTTFKWVRGELIGRGTYGRVYLAMNATTGEMMAVKQVEIPQTASDKNDTRQVTVVQALKLESETLKDLDHANIVQYLGFEETPSNLSIFLEYVPGGSIGSCLLKHGKFDEEVTKSFTGQILAGLEYLHSRGILHRDLKADNILVEKSGICKISDFGISKRTDDMGGGAMTAMQGTVFWMAPEVINAQKKGYNFKIDIWSVGCVVLEMWAGMRPWNGDEAIAVMFKLYQAKLPPPVPEDVVLSDLADDFRRKCFAINPEERPTASELRKHRYLELMDGWVFNGFI